MSISDNLKKYKSQLPENVTLVAVSKTKPITVLQEAYQTGQRVFGENKIQEMVEKWEQLPKDISWHMIGHVQTNKVKYMAPFVSLIHAVDSLKLLKEIDKQAFKNHRTINCLLQIKIAEEDSKYGLDKQDALTLIASQAYKDLKNVKVVGLMGMATFTEDATQIAQEFTSLQTFYKKVRKTNPTFKTLSMGMSGDYLIAIEKGSTMVRIGSAIFGARNYN